MTEAFHVPLIIRGEITDDAEVEHGGRRGGAAFRSRDIRKHLAKLPLRTPSKMADLYALSFDEGRWCMSSKQGLTRWWPRRAKSTPRSSLIVTRGECVANGSRYRAGDLRIQASGTAFSVSEGPEGAHLVLIVADRRADIRSTARQGWMDAVPRLVEALEVHPGGTWRALAA